MQNIHITEAGVYNILSQLDPHKAGGPDNIPARVLKELTHDLTPLATYSFISAIVGYQYTTTRMELAFITPIFKKGKKI